MWKIILVMSYLVHSAISQKANDLTDLRISEISTPKLHSVVAPIWDDDTQSLYFVNIQTTGKQTSIFRYSARENYLYAAYIKGLNSPAFILPNGKGCKNQFVVGYGKEVWTIKWDGKSNKAKKLERLFSLDANITSSRTSLAKADSKGRFYGGTSFSPDQCIASVKPILSFYRYDRANGSIRLFGGLKSTGGIAIDEKARKLYHLDVCTLLIHVFDWNPRTGDTSNRQVAFDFQKFNDFVPLNFPLGLEIDTEGFLYTNQPASVWKINPRKSTLVRTIDFSPTVLNGVAFGGRRRDILYTIAASNYVNPFTLEPIAEYRNGTSLYAIEGLNAKGAPSNFLKI